MSSSASRPKRKATRQSYADDQQPSDVDMSDGEQQKTRLKRGVNKNASSSKSKGKAKQSAVAESEEEDELDSSSDAEHMSKKLKRTKKTRRNSKGKSKVQGIDRITSLPIELLTEICTYATPGDLLSLSRTNKAFRKQLLDPDSLSLWKNAREAVGLPDLTIEMTEPQYARLMYGKECQECGSKKIQPADVYIRKVLCKPCREKNWINVSNALSEHPELHADVINTSLVTPHSAKDARWPGSCPRYAYLPDVKTLSDCLWEAYADYGVFKKYKTPSADIDIDDEEELLREIVEENEANLAGRSTRTRQTRRPSFYGSGSSSAPPQTSIKDEDDEPRESDEEKEDGQEEDGDVVVKAPSHENEEDDELQSGDEEEDEPVSREEFLAIRKIFRDHLKRDGDSLRIAADVIRSDERQQAATQKEKDKDAGADRRADIEAKVLELGDYTEADFTGAWYTSKIVNSPEALTDENWETVKPKVIKLLARIKQKEAELEVVLNSQERQEALRARHKKLLDIQPNQQSRYSLPLFPDFLQLDSVKPFWEPEDANPEDDDAWAEQFEAILEELDDYRISVRLNAVQMILGATTEIDEKELDGDVDDFGPENFDDDWLNFPTSYLACSLSNCRQRARYARSERLTYFAPLPALLEHQHKEHADITFTEKEMKKRKEQGHVGDFHLPPLVVSALSAIIELTGKSDDQATVIDLDELMGGRRGAVRSDASQPMLIWENSLKKKYFRSWEELIEEAIKQSAKASKEGRVLEVPIIEFRDYAAEAAERHQQQLEKMLKKRGSKKKKTYSARKPWEYDSD